MKLNQIKNLIHCDEFTASRKVLDQIDNGEYTTNDLTTCIITAERIYKSEHDEHVQAVDGLKHIIIGYDTHGARFYTAGKIRQDYRSRYYFFITAHSAD